MTALVLFVAIVFAVAEMRRTGPPTPNELAQSEYEQIYEETIAQVTDRGAEYVQLFNSNKLEELHGHFAPPMKQIMSLEDLRLMREARSRQLGYYDGLIEQSVAVEGENFVYDQISKFHDYEGEVQILITMNAATEIVGFTIQPYYRETSSEDE